MKNININKNNKKKRVRIIVIRKYTGERNIEQVFSEVLIRALEKVPMVA